MAQTPVSLGTSMPLTAPELVRVEELSFTYPDASAPILKGVNLTLRPGELVIVTGPSGCGKTTLCRHLNGIIPQLSSGQQLGGRVLVKGIDASCAPVHVLATLVGMVFQNPESQICCLEVEDELAFGPENIGLTHEEIVARVDQVVDWVSLEDVRKAFTFQLSGGQKQRIAIGSSLALRPDILCLDEPTTDLDPVGKQEIVATLRALRDGFGLTFLVIEHDLDELIEIADRLIVMDGGQIMLDGRPADLLNAHFAQLDAIGLRIPQHVLMARRLIKHEDPERPFPITRREAVQVFAEWAGRQYGSLPVLPVSSVPVSGTASSHIPALKMEHVTFSYDGRRNAVEDISLEIGMGEFVALVGANGSGKSTLARLSIGLHRPQRGEISVLGMNTKQVPLDQICARVGYLFQNPDSQLFSHTVRSEIAFGMRVKKMPENRIEHTIQEVLALLKLEHLADRHPFALSRGERQRLAMATVLVTDPDIIILDEPTTGQDRRTLDGLINLMHGWIQRKQATVVMVSHDMDLVCKHATRVVVLRDGRIVCDGTPADVFYQSFTMLKDMNLAPPAMVEASYPFVGSKLPRVLLSMEDLEALLDPFRA